MTSRRDGVKKRKRAQKLGRRLRIRRDKEITELYGDEGHRSCGRKMKYQDEDDALTHAKIYQVRGSEKLYAYQCKLCGGWHLTKMPPELFASIKEAE